MSTQEVIEFWDPSGLLQGTPDDKKGDLANLLTQASEYMKDHILDDRVVPLVLPMVVRLFNSGEQDIKDIGRVIDIFVYQFLLKADIIYSNDSFEYLNNEIEFTLSFVESYKTLRLLLPKD